MPRGWVWDYARDRFPQLGSRRCACGRVSRHMGIDNRSHMGVAKCYVCSGHYDCQFCKRFFRDIDRHRAQWHPNRNARVA